MKKILIVSDILTHPVTGGNRACILQNADLLRSMGFDVYFLYLCNYDEPESAIESTREYWGNRFFVYRLRGLQRFYRKVMGRIHRKSFNRIDFFFPWGLNKFVESLHKQFDFHGLLVNYVWMSKLSETSIPRKALYTHDVFSYRAQRVAVPNYSWKTFPVSEEAKGIRRFEHILAIQSNEACFFRYLAPHCNVYASYSPVKSCLQPLALNKNILFFSGAGDLNVNGLDWFINRVLPIIVQSDSNIRLLVGGGICSAIKSRYSNPNIELIGRVDNPEEFYSKGDIAINSVYQGTGLKIKTLEGVAFGKFVVTSTHSAEGLYAPAQLPVNITDNPREFAQAILSAINNEPLLQKNKTLCHNYIDNYNSYIKSIYSKVFVDEDVI